MSMLQKLRRKAAPLTAAAAVTALPVVASADTQAAITKVGTDVASAISMFVTVISAIGLAGVSVVVLITAFKMAFSFVKGMK
ncbi:MAG: hypothetical protein Q4A62_06065 [Eikenella sp.]|nr:hypothetical protein [Eikenella sp.]